MRLNDQAKRHGCFERQKEENDQPRRKRKLPKERGQSLRACLEMTRKPRIRGGSRPNSTSVEVKKEEPQVKKEEPMEDTLMMNIDTIPMDQSSLNGERGNENDKRQQPSYLTPPFSEELPDTQRDMLQATASFTLPLPDDFERQGDRNEGRTVPEVEIKPDSEDNFSHAEENKEDVNNIEGIINNDVDSSTLSWSELSRMVGIDLDRRKTDWGLNDHEKKYWAKIQVVDICGKPPGWAKEQQLCFPDKVVVKINEGETPVYDNQQGLDDRLFDIFGRGVELLER